MAHLVGVQVLVPFLSYGLLMAWRSKTAVGNLEKHAVLCCGYLCENLAVNPFATRIIMPAFTSQQLVSSIPQLRSIQAPGAAS